MDCVQRAKAKKFFSFQEVLYEVMKTANETANLWQVGGSKLHRSPYRKRKLLKLFESQWGSFPPKNCNSESAFLLLFHWRLTFASCLDKEHYVSLSGITTILPFLIRRKAGWLL